MSDSSGGLLAVATLFPDSANSSSRFLLSGGTPRATEDAERRGGRCGAQQQDPRSVTTGGKIISHEDQHNLAHIDWLAFTIKPPEDSALPWLWPYLRSLFSIPCMEQVKRKRPAVPH